MRIYIAGPYSAQIRDDRVTNTFNAIDAGILLVKKGHAPFIPHLTHFVDERSVDIGTPLSWEDYIRWDLEWLKVCDAILYLGSSRGADIELAAAVAAGLTVFTLVDDVPDAL